MFSKSVVWSTLVAFLFFFFVPYAFYTGASECLNSHVIIDISRDIYLLPQLALGVLILSYAFVRIFHQWSGGIFSNQNGFVFGLWIALFQVVAMGLIRHATTEAVSIPFYVLDSVYWAGMYAIGGVLVAMVCRKTHWFIDSETYLF